MNSSMYFRDSKYKHADVVQWVLLLTDQSKLTKDFTVRCVKPSTKRKRKCQQLSALAIIAPMTKDVCFFYILIKSQMTVEINVNREKCRLSAVCYVF